MTPHLAVFDIDGTLLPHPSSERRFIRHLLAQRHLGYRQLVSWVAFVPRWRRRFGPAVWVKNKAYLNGLRLDEVSHWAAQFVTRELAPLWRSEVLDRLQEHQSRGDRIMLLSGTSQFLADAIAHVLRTDEAVGTLCDLDGGRLTDKPPLRHPFGNGKLALVAAARGRLGIEWAEVTAYGDSRHDLPLLEAVGRPVAVAPDHVLRHAAQVRGWEILAAKNGRNTARAGGGPRDRKGQ